MWIIYVCDREVEVVLENEMFVKVVVVCILVKLLGGGSDFVVSVWVVGVRVFLGEGCVDWKER